MCIRPYIRLCWHFCGFSGYGHCFDIRNNIATTNDLYHRSNTDFVLLDELPIKPRCIFDFHPVNIHRIDTHPGFQIPVFRWRPDHISDLRFCDLVRNHHLERKCMFGVLVCTLVRIVVRDNHSVNLIFVQIPTLDERIRK